MVQAFVFTPDEVLGRVLKTTERTVERLVVEAVAQINGNLERAILKPGDKLGVQLPYNVVVVQAVVDCLTAAGWQVSYEVERPNILMITTPDPAEFTQNEDGSFRKLTDAESKEIAAISEQVAAMAPDVEASAEIAEATPAPIA